MLHRWLQTLDSSRWPIRLFGAFILLPPLAMAFAGEAWRGLGTFLFLASIYVGIQLGAVASLMFLALSSNDSETFARRLGAAGSGAGFVALPAVVGTLTNAYLDTRINMPGLWVMLLWACAAGVVVFLLAER